MKWFTVATRLALRVRRSGISVNCKLMFVALMISSIALFFCVFVFPGCSLQWLEQEALLMFFFFNFYIFLCPDWTIAAWSRPLSRMFDTPVLTTLSASLTKVIA